VLGCNVADESEQPLEPLFLDIKAAAKIAGVSPDTLKVAIHKGSLQAKMTGVNMQGDPVGKYLMTREALMAWFETLPDA
jgi:hypothetical protein